MDLVTLAYADLAAGKDLTADVLRAYGPSGLGALTVSGIPEYVELRERLLLLSYTLAHLPEVFVYFVFLALVGCISLETVVCALSLDVCSIATPGRSVTYHVTVQW